MSGAEVSWVAYGLRVIRRRPRATRGLLVGVALAVALAVTAAVAASQMLSRARRYSEVAQLVLRFDQRISSIDPELVSSPDQQWDGPPTCIPVGRCRAPRDVMKSLLFRTGPNDLGLDVDVHLFFLRDGGVALGGAEVSPFGAQVARDEFTPGAAP